MGVVALISGWLSCVLLLRLMWLEIGCTQQAEGAKRAGGEKRVRVRVRV
jgi:hypothetical protein